MSRPFGVALLIAGYDKTGFSLFHTDPSGTYVRYNAKAIGQASEGAQTKLLDTWNAGMTYAQAEEEAVRTLKEVMEEKLTNTNVSISGVTADRGFHIYSQAELEAVVARLG